MTTPRVCAAHSIAIRETQDLLRTANQRDGLAWARRIVAREAAGERVPMISVQWACEALRRAVSDDE